MLFPGSVLSAKCGWAEFPKSLKIFQKGVDEAGKQWYYNKAVAKRQRAAKSGDEL